MDQSEKPKSEEEKEAEEMNERDEERNDELTSQCEEVKFLNELETQIQTFPAMNDIISYIIDPLSDVSKDVVVQKFNKKLFNWLKVNINRVISIAVKYEKHNVVNFLVECGVKVNGTDDNGHSAADYAYAKKNYKILLLLLQADSFFPAGFNLNEINYDEDEANEIKNLVYQRNKLHETIKDGEVEDVKNLTLVENSTLYLNINNESAAYNALKHQKFKTYAFLKSIGAEFANIGEEKIIDTFELKENVILQEAMVEYFPAVPDAHIYFLMSKSRSQKPIKGLTAKLQYYYNKLSEYPEISLILKVVQYADYLDIIFDFDEEDVSKVYPLRSKKDCCRGETEYKVGRIYVAAGLKRKPQEILGTIAHELTHMALQMLLDNDCNPYRESDKKTVHFFQNFKSQICTERKILMKSGEPSKILMDATGKYDEADHDSELIVRVPQILVQFEEGRDWLEKNVPKISSFYKETILRKCEDFIKESVILKPKNIIKSLNEKIGVIAKLKKCNLKFKNAENLFEMKDKKIFVIKVESTLLGMLKVLQRLYGKDYTNFHTRFLALKFTNFVRQLKEISQDSVMKCCDRLIIEISDLPMEDELERVCEIMSELLQHKKHMEIIFVANQKVIKCLWTMLNNFNLEYICEEIPDEHLRLDNLDSDSQKLILKKKVSFHGKQISLQKLIQTPQLYNLINAKIIERILEEKEVILGNEIMGMSSSEGAYADIHQQIDFPSFVRQVEDSNDIFIVRPKSNYEVVMEYFNSKFGKDSVNTEFLTDVTYELSRKKYEDKIFFVNDRFESKKFKTFCRINFEKKCFLIEEKDLGTDCFFLQEFYNPYFYLNRNVKVRSIKLDQAKNMISECTAETFILSNVFDTKLNNFMECSNVKCFTDCDEAEKNFKMLSERGSERGNNVHWFNLENDSLIWVYSHGTVKYLRDPLQIYGDFKMCDEEKFCLDVANKRILLVADNPGTGKSTTLTKLYSSKPIIDNHWIIRINLKDHLEALREEVNSKDLDAGKIIRFLQKIDSNLKTELDENLLKIMLTAENNFAKYLLLAFDGFDEILDEDDRENIINVLKYLKNKTHCKVWITTRVHYKQDLEIALTTLAIEFTPFDPEKQKLFIRKYLEDRLNLVLKLEKFNELFNDQQDSKISIFTERLLIKMKEIFKGDLTKFIGVPLQLHLVMSGSMEYFKTWIENEKELDFNYLGNDLLDVYGNFIDKKYAVYFKKINITENKRQIREKKDSENYNKSLADSLIYKQKALKPEDDDKEIFLLVGIIQLQKGDNFEFIHFTFREYYFAQQYAEYIISKAFIAEKIEFLFTKILTKPEFQVIRNFLNIKLKETPTEKRLEKLQSLIFSADVLKPYTTRDSALAVAAQEGLENISKFICFLYFHKTSTFFNVTDILNETVFRSAAVVGNAECYTALWNIFKTFSNLKWESFYFKSLLTDIIIFAAEKSKFEFIEKILEKIEESLPKNEIFEFLKLVHNKKCKSSIHIVTEFCRTNMSFSISFMKFLILILNMGSKCLSQKERKKIFMNHIREDEFSSALFSASSRKDAKFMELLLNECKVVMKPEEEYHLLKTSRKYGQTILHIAAVLRNLEVTKLILKEIENIGNPEKQAEFIMLADNYGSTALYEAVEENNTDVVNLLIGEGEKLLNKEKFLEYITGYNTMNRKFRPLPYIRFNESIKCLYQKGETMLSPEDRSRWLMTSDKFHESLLEKACFRNDSEMISFLFEKLRYEEINKLLKAKSIEDSPARQYFTAEKIVTSEILELLPEIEKFLSSENENESIMTRNAFTLLAQGAVSVIKFLMEKITESLKPEKELEFFSLNNFSNTMFLLKTSPVEMIELPFKQIEKLPGGHHFYIQLFNSNNNFFSSIVENQDDRVAKFILDKMDKLLDLEDKRKFLMRTDEHGCTCLHLATEKNRKNLLKIFFEKAKKILSYCEQCDLLLMKDKQGNTVLHTFTRNERKRLDTDILEWLLETADELLQIEEKGKFLTMTNEDNQSCLHVLFNPNFQVFPSKPNLRRELILKLILEKAHSVLSSEKLRELLLKKNRFGAIFPLLYFAECDTDPEFLLEISEKMLKPEDLDMLITEIWNRLLKGNFRDETKVEKLLVYIDTLFAPEKKQQIFMVAKYKKIRNGSPLIFYILSRPLLIINVGCLLEKLKTEFTPNQQIQFFNTVDGFYGTVFHIVTKFKRFNEIKLVFKEGEKMLKQNFHRVFQLQDVENRNILQLAVFYRNCEVLDFIINLGNRILTTETQKEILMKTDWENKTVLHLAVLDGNQNPYLKYERAGNEGENFNLMYLLLKEAKKLFTIEEQRQFLKMKDESGMTAFQYAVEFEEVEAVKLLLQVAEKCFSGKDLQKFILDQAIAEGTECFSEQNYMITNLITEFLEEKRKAGDKRPEYF